MSGERPVAEPGEDRTNEAFSYCDCCDALTWWDELHTGDDGETWVCWQCVESLGGVVS